MRVPSQALLQGLDLAMRETGDPLIALHAAQAVRPLHLGDLGYALMSSSQGEHGLAVYERFQSLLCNELLARHRVVDGLIEVRHEGIGISLPRSAHFWWFLLGARLHFARWVSGRELVPVRIELPCPRPPHADAFDRFVGCAVRYDAPGCRELMPSDWLSWLNPHADPAMHTLMQLRTAQQLADEPQGNALLLLTRQAVGHCLDDGKAVDLKNVVDALMRLPQAAAMSARQLQRSLSEQGHPFKTLVEQVRRERALRLLRDSQQAVVDIALACGYADVSPFHRAIKRWTGLTPAQVRLQGHTAAAASP